MPVETIDVLVTSDNAVVPRVRFLSRQVGAVLGCRIDVDLVALLTTEVLSNAVREATGPVGAVFSMPTPDRLRVEISDRSPRRPEVLHPGPLDDGGHRGLMVVERLASAWGVEARPVGKVVWFEVRAAPPFDDVQPGAEAGVGEPRPTNAPTSAVPTGQPPPADRQLGSGPDSGSSSPATPDRRRNHERRQPAQSAAPRPAHLGPEQRARVDTSR